MITLIENFSRISTLLFGLICIYSLSMVLYGISLFIRNQSVYTLGRFSLFVGFLINGWLIIERWMAAGRPPFKTFYESLVFAAFCIVLVYLVLELVRKVKLVGFGSILMALIALLVAVMKVDVEIISLPPALQSGWFIPHVVIYFIGYGALAVSFATGVMYLFFPDVIELSQDTLKGRFLTNALGGETIDLETFTHQLIVVGFTFLNLGLLTGSIWAKFAWGDYWFWDPKENWSLITWLIYLTYFHLRYVKGWRGRKAVVFSIVGFLAVIFTYLGMHLLPTAEMSEHVYTE